jgi:hypothetical protein
VTVSKALNTKSLYEWKDALQLLRRPTPENITTMQSKIYCSIELSYKYIESKEVRDFFLLCSQLVTTLTRGSCRNIVMVWVFISWYGMNTMEDARNIIFVFYNSPYYERLMSVTSSSPQLC